MSAKGKKVRTKAFPLVGKGDRRIKFLDSVVDEGRRGKNNHLQMPLSGQLKDCFISFPFIPAVLSQKRLC